jgi:hypothetical protein
VKACCNASGKFLLVFASAFLIGFPLSSHGDPPKVISFGPPAVTNFFQLQRYLEPGSDLVWQTRTWTSCGNFRELRDQLVPSNTVVSLEQFTEEDWLKVEPERELIHNATGTFVRTRGSSGWEQSPSASAVTNQVPLAGKNATTTGRGFQPLLLDRQSVATDSPLFDMKPLRKNPGAVWGRGRVSWKSTSQSGMSTVAWVLEFDLETRLKTHEQVWFDGHLIQEQYWQTNVAIDPEQFETPTLAADGLSNRGPLPGTTHEDTADKWREPLPRYVFHARAQPLAGIGVIILDSIGPFKVLTVTEGGAAQKAGIRGGDTVTGIDGASLSGIPLLPFISLCRGQAGTPVTVDVQEAGTGEQKRIELQRAEITTTHSPGKSPTGN